MTCCQATGKADYTQPCCHISNSEPPNLPLLGFIEFVEAEVTQISQNKVATVPKCGGRCASNEIPASQMWGNVDLADALSFVNLRNFQNLR